jgi:hypothetical protein
MDDGKGMAEAVVEGDEEIAVVAEEGGVMLYG